MILRSEHEIEKKKKVKVRGELYTHVFVIFHIPPYIVYADPSSASPPTPRQPNTKTIIHDPTSPQRNHWYRSLGFDALDIQYLLVLHLPHEVTLSFPLLPRGRPLVGTAGRRRPVRMCRIGRQKGGRDINM
eukprot:321333-Amorphochlora_amoeboformis.AAC.1